MSVDLAKLEALAKAATPGPWLTEGPFSDGWQIISTRIIAEGDTDSARDIRFIAAADPPTVLALIAEIRQERERADANEGRWDDAEATSDDWHSEFERVSAALSRAEETIAAALAEEERCTDQGTRMWRILNDYERQEKP